jgi:putative peptidoglycan lipid II flippase
MNDHDREREREEAAAATEAWQAVAGTDDAIHVDPHAGERRAEGKGNRLAFSAIFFSIATGLSRIVGLLREMIAAAIFGVSGVMSAFQAAFLVPNLVRALFADAALQAAFVPVFSELLDRGEKREAFRVASTLFYIMLLSLGLITGLFILAAPLIMPLFAPGLNAENTDLMIGLSRVLFPIVVLLGITGLFVGMLNAFDHFEVPAIAPLFWNLAIIACIYGLRPLLPDDQEIYAYAIGVVVGTIIQMLMPLPLVKSRAKGEPFGRTFDWHDPYVRKVLKLMIPVSVGLGLINFDLAINSIVGSLVSQDAIAAINNAFRIFMLPQGIFSVAIATILFPTLSRLASRRDHDGMTHTIGNGTRQMYMMLIPAAVAIAVLATPMVRLVYQRGEFTAYDTTLVATALFWFAFSLPTSGSNLLYTRSFFALQRPWFATGLSVISLAINAGLSYAFHEPFGIAGVVGATAFSSLFMTVAQGYYLTDEIGGVEAGQTFKAALQMFVACIPLALIGYGVWYGLDEALGRSTIAQIISLGSGLALGTAAYAAGVFAMKIPEAQQISALVRSRLGR